MFLLYLLLLGEDNFFGDYFHYYNILSIGKEIPKLDETKIIEYSSFDQEKYDVASDKNIRKFFNILVWFN